MTNNKRVAITSVCYLAVFAILLIALVMSPNAVEAKSTNTTFDTSIIEDSWCGNFTDGAVRMVGARWQNNETIVDEQGELWEVDCAIDPTDFLLLWVADNNTPNDVTDDIIVKVWREAR